MKTRVITLLLLLAGAFFTLPATAQGTTPVAEKAVMLPCGQAQAVALPGKEQRFQKIDVALREGQFEIDQNGGGGKLLSERRAAPGKVFVIMAVAVGSGRSLSRYDFALQVGEKLYNALAITLPGNPFDPRLVTVKTPSTVPKTEAHLLYELPKGTQRATIVSALPRTLPFTPIPIQIQ